MIEIISFCEDHYLVSIDNIFTGIEMIWLSVRRALKLAGGIADAKLNFHWLILFFKVLTSDSDHPAERGTRAI